MNNFRISILGDSGVGKTSFMQRFLTGEFTNTGLTSFSLTLQTNYGPYTLFLTEELTVRPDTHASVIMFDVTNPASYATAEILTATSAFLKIPAVVVGNKVDVKDRKVKPKQIDIHHRYSVKYYDISAKSLYNHEKPFLTLLRTLTGHDDLVFINA